MIYRVVKYKTAAEVTMDKDGKYHIWGSGWHACHKNICAFGKTKKEAGEALKRARKRYHERYGNEKI